MTLLYERSFGVRNGEMPVYFFGLPDDLALPEVSEELANDAEASLGRSLKSSQTTSAAIDTTGSKWRYWSLITVAS